MVFKWCAMAQSSAGMLHAGKSWKSVLRIQYKSGLNSKTIPTRTCTPFLLRKSWLLTLRGWQNRGHLHPGPFCPGAL